MGTVRMARERTVTVRSKVESEGGGENRPFQCCSCWQRRDVRSRHGYLEPLLRWLRSKHLQPTLLLNQKKNGIRGGSIFRRATEWHREWRRFKVRCDASMGAYEVQRSLNPIMGNGIATLFRSSRVARLMHAYLASEQGLFLGHLLCQVEYSCKTFETAPAARISTKSTVSDVV